MIYKKVEIKVEGYQEIADLYTYILDNSVEMRPNRKRPVIVICPGGGYTMTSDREAEPIAMQYLARGYHAVILRYSVAPARYPLALLQLAKSVAYLREHAEEFHIDTAKIILQGFSAGAHLAASLGVFWKEKFISEVLHTETEMVRPNGMILSYPVISSGKFAHTGSFEALHKYKVSVELHLYPTGVHGLSLANEETSHEDGGCIQPECQSWMELACTWIRNL